MSHWASVYLGDAWEAKRHDCWGFFRRVQREQFGRDIPVIDPENYRAPTKTRLFLTHPHRADWIEIEHSELREGDGVRMANANNPGHVGIWIEVDGGRVLHCDSPGGVMATPLPAICDIYPDIQFYRFAGDHADANS